MQVLSKKAKNIAAKLQLTPKASDQGLTAFKLSQSHQKLLLSGSTMMKNSDGIAKRNHATTLEVQVRRREQAAGRLAAAKALKRRWDPSKEARKLRTSSAGSAAYDQVQCQVLSHASGELSDDGFTFKDPRAQSELGKHSSVFDHGGGSDLNAAVGTTASPTSDEFLAIHALTQLAEGGAAHILKDTRLDEPLGLKVVTGLVEVQDQPTGFKVDENPIDDWRADSSGDTSILEKANQLGSLEWEGYPYLPARNSNIPLAVRRSKLPPGVTPLNRLQEVALRITGDVGPVTVVQAAQIEVAELNSGELSTPTPEDVANWRVPGRLVSTLWSWQDLTKKEIAMGQWRVAVCKAIRRARLAGEKVEEGAFSDESRRLFVNGARQGKR
ncbi:hypothetical protein C8R43DRAFT_957229 [Mycena crocata]|nr:hypothetical protein C8R43DRAFT_957229 [Mycena crocata]